MRYLRITAGFNQPNGLHDPTAHAKILALCAVVQRLSNYRLPECELFVTLEHCAPWASFSAVTLKAAFASASIAQ